MIGPTNGAFIAEKKISETNTTITFSGYYGAKAEEFNFFWGSANKTFTRKKWLKKLRYLRNKGLAVQSNNSMTLPSNRNYG